MECPQIDLYEFLAESELQHYYNAIKNELKITSAAQFKYATDEDLRSIGLSRPEIRRLRKYYEKHFPHGYLSKIKRLLQAPTAMVIKREDGTAGTYSPTSSSSTTQSTETLNSAKLANSSPGKVPNNKHIIPADSISVNKQLGTGEFGIVQQGVWSNGNERIQVAIKCLCRERMQSNPMEFLKEAAIMHSIEHENIVRLYGVVLATDSLMLVTELAHLRSLLECLKDSGLRVSFLTIPTLCEFAMQICNGMSYLEQNRLIHRDLAARNILVFSKNKVKISDFGLSRALGVGKDYYKTNFNVNLKLPIAWCAPECINYLRFTNASDVWAFGVCLWEMFSYGFQPWAALTGLQILEAIDAPNYQRLEQPDCCPREYYTLMMKCWQDDPAKRPKFSEIYELLPDMKPEQLKSVANCLEGKSEHLIYRQGEIITVLDRNTGTPFWKGVLNTGKTGFFNPSNTVAFLEGLPCSNRDSFCRISERSSKRKLRTEMISKPQNDFKHTGHVGIDGVSFGDVAFLSNSQNYNHVPRQIVTPYKPSEDIEQTPLLLPPTPTSPDSFQTASAYFPDGTACGTTQSLNPSFVSSTENTPKKFSTQSSFEFPSHEGQSASLPPHINTSTNPFASKQDGAMDVADATTFAMTNNNYGIHAHGIKQPSEDSLWRQYGLKSAEDPHEYHEISDDEITADKLDFGPSLLDEINSMFGSMSAASGSGHKPKSPTEFELTNSKNEFAELTAKLVSKQNSCGAGDSNGNKFHSSSTSKKKTPGTVRQISVKDERILNHAIEIANEISAKSMVDLVSAEQPVSAQSPKRKFSFRFPHLHSNGGDKYAIGGGIGGTGNGVGAGHTAAQFRSGSPSTRKKNFSEEIDNIPDLQQIIGDDAREAYNSLIERKGSLGGGSGMSPVATLLRHLDTNEFAEIATARTLPRRSMHAGGQDAHTLLLQQQQLQQQQHLQQTNTSVPPFQQAPRPMTLPTRGATHKVRRAEFKRGSTLPADAAGLDESSRDDDNDVIAAAEEEGKENQSNNSGTPCESPSYLTHTAAYKFPAEQPDGVLDPNLIPLPPRDGKKHIKTNPKRHVRKYPLIIPANGVQRTLSKLADSTHDGMSEEQCAKRATVNVQRITFEMVPAARADAPRTSTPLQNLKLQMRHMRTSSADESEHNYQNVANDVNDDSASLQFESILEANKGQVLQSPDVTDGFYNFSIQKEHYNKGREVDYGAQKMSGLYVNEDELRNLDIDGNSSRVAAAATSPNASTANVMPSSSDTTSTAAAVAAIVTASMPREKPPRAKKTGESGELAGNPLFQRVRATVDQAMLSRPKMATVTTNAAPPTEAAPHMSASLTTPSPQRLRQTEAEYFAATAARLASSNSVSCEDLLEFSDKKPKGCERGVDSDEVRIMMKVLGKDSTPTRCLHVLEFIDWDVHKAIKVLKLQNILASLELNLSESVEVLQEHEWDLHTSALKLKGLRA